MIRKIFVKPVAGARVRDPYRTGKPLLGSDGDWVPDNAYWRRRIKFGECALGEGPKEAPSKPAQKSRVREGDK
jgi:hypothetical protein